MSLRLRWHTIERCVPMSHLLSRHMYRQARKGISVALLLPDQSAALVAVPFARVLTPTDDQGGCLYGKVPCSCDPLENLRL